MLATIIAFLVMLNPFALFVVLEPIRRGMDNRQYARLLLKASLNSAVLFIVFFLTGEALITNVFQIHFEAFRIFGGIVIFALAFLYIVKDRRALIELRTDMNELAIDVSVPFMVGAGTVSLSILMARTTTPLIGIALLLGILTLNYLIILCLAHLRRLLTGRAVEQYDLYMSLTMRINIFFIGAIGVDMVIRGITVFF